MDQIKIGKFIAACRKEQGMTQMQLAEKLNITDRAISKWETGKAMPDSSIVLELCRLLDITANDLFNGERISSEDYGKKTAAQLVEVLKQKEVAEKHLMRLKTWMDVLSLIFAAVMIPIWHFSKNPGFVVGTLPLWFLSLLFTRLTRPVDYEVGFYQCDKCKHTQVPKRKKFTLNNSFGDKMDLRCPHCNKRTSHTKVFTKE